MRHSHTGHARTTHARPIGRALRLLLGAYLIIVIAPFFASAQPLPLLEVAATFLLFVVAYTVIHLGVTRWARRLNPWLGAALASLPVVTLYLLGGTVGRVTALGYVGVSLLVDFANGDKGCEVMAVPALILKGRTHLACLVLSPVDSLEDKVSQWFAAKASSRHPPA